MYLNVPDYKIMTAALMAIEPEKVFAMPDSNLPNDEFKLMLTLSDLADRETRGYDWLGQTSSR